MGFSTLSPKLRQRQANVTKHDEDPPRGLDEDLVAHFERVTSCLVLGSSAFYDCQRRQRQALGIQALPTLWHTGPPQRQVSDVQALQLICSMGHRFIPLSKVKR